MKNFLHDIKKIAAGWLLVFFVGYVACATLFYHTHIIDGTRAAHSHPYSEAPDSGRHTHTAAEFASIASLSTLLMLAPVLGCVIEAAPPCIIIRQCLRGYSYSGRDTSPTALRGPPVC